MLLLSRKPGQSIQITTSDGQQITVQICRIDSKQVKVGIEAPVSG